MKCGQAEKWMDAALDEASGGADLVPAGWTAQRRGALEAHLSECPACRAQWDVLRSAEAVLRVPKPVPAPESLLADFRERLAAERQAAEPLQVVRAAAPELRRRGGWRWLWPLGSLAAAGVAAAAVFMFNIQVPVASVQESPSIARRGYIAPSTPASAATEPDRFGRKLALTKPAAPGSSVRAQLSERADPTLQRMAGVPSLDATVRQVVPPLPEGPAHQRTPRSAMVLAHPEEELRGLDRTSTLSTRAKEPLPYDLPVSEHESLTQQAPSHVDSLSRGRQTVAKAQVELEDKMSLYTRQRGEAQSGQQKQFGALAGSSLQIVPNVKPQNQSQSQALGQAASNTIQLAQNNDLYYAQVPAEPTPVELNVSAAVLNALQRPVELRTTNAMQVQDLAVQLSTKADVEVKVDPQVAKLNVTVEESGAPLWRVLEDVARQTQLEIYPSDNTLLLRRSAPAAALALGVVDKNEARRPEARTKLDKVAKKDLDFRYRGAEMDPKAPPEAPVSPVAAPAPVNSAGAAGSGGSGFGGGAAPRGGIDRPARKQSPPAGPPAPSLGLRYVYANRQPDRKFWPAAWGNLPERGFEVPTAEELPPLILAPIQVGKAVTNEVPHVRPRRKMPAKPVGAKSPARKPRSPR